MGINLAMPKEVVELLRTQQLMTVFSFSLVVAADQRSS